MTDNTDLSPLQPPLPIDATSFDPSFAAREASLYVQSGYRPIPLRAADKDPTPTNWQSVTYDPVTLGIHFPYSCNLGVITGTPHPDDPTWRHIMIDIDCSINDDVTALRVLRCLPPDVYPTRTGLAHRINFHCMSDVQFKSAGKLTVRAQDSYPFAYDGLTKTGKPKYAQIEIRGTNHQSMMGNSLHPGDPRLPERFVTRWLGPALHVYPIAALPRLSRFRLQEILAIYTEPSAAIHRLADAAPGSIHDSIVYAVAWMVNNKWPEQDIRDRMDVLWQQLSNEWDPKDLDRDDRKFEQEWLSALQSAKGKFQGDEKPSKAARAAEPQEGGKLRLPRLMADRWRDLNTREDGVSPRVDAMGQIRTYQNGWWKIKPILDIRYELMREFNTLGGGDAKEAVTTLMDTLDRMPVSEHELICTRNGSLDLHTLTLHEHSPDFGLTTAVPFEFDPHPVSPIYDSFMAETFKQVMWGDEDDRTQKMMAEDALIMKQTWEEFCGYCLTNSTALQSMMVVVGPTGSGKSTIAKSLSWMLPEEDISATPLSKMEDARYHAGILSKRVNVSFETGTSYSEATDFINSTAAGDPQTVRRMREEPFSVVSPVKLIFVGNRMLRTSDTSGAIQRRMVVTLAPNKRSDAKDRDASFPERLRMEAGAIFSRYVLAGNNLLKRGHFLSSHYSRLALDQNTKLDSVSSWFAERCEYSEDVRMPNEMLYSDYRIWAQEQGFKPVNVIEWGTRVSQIDDRLHARQARIPGTKNGRQRVRPIKYLEGVKPNNGPEGGNY